MVIEMRIIEKLPLDTGVIGQDGKPIYRMKSLKPAVGCCLVFNSVEQAVKCGAVGPFQEINLQELPPVPEGEILH